MHVDYVLPLIAGGLGNNLFMIANAYAKAKKYNKKLYLPKKGIDQEYIENVFKNFDFLEEYVDNQVYNLVVPSDTTHTLYSGYFQSEKCFDEYSEEIKDVFGPPLDFVNRIRLEIPALFAKETTAINVRKGDYLYYPNYHPTVSKEYIFEALKQVPSEQYLIVSDDIPWCKQNLNIDGAIYLEGYKRYEQLWILSMCHHFIISNSSFSWWGAYLSRNKNKLVIAPETWYGPDGPQHWEEIYCKDWIKFPTYFKDGLIYPK